MAISAGDVLRHQTVRGVRNALRDKTHLDLFPDGIAPIPSASEGTIRRLPAHVTDIYPVTGIQLFMLEKYAQNRGTRGVYHIQECLRLHDDSLSLPALDEAFHLVVDRHPALRTVFDMESTPPMQWVCRDLNWRAHVDDISGLTPHEQDEYVARALLSDRSHLFEYSDHKMPLFRVTVYLRSATELDLFFSCHHALLDGWGHRVMSNQLFEAYSQLKSGIKPELGEPDAGCKEFAAFQEAVRRSPKASAFWRNYLNGIEPPSLNPPALVPSPEPEQLAFVRPLESADVHALESLARETGISMQALLLGAWMETLHGWSGDRVVVSGVVSNGRSEYLSDPLSAVGLFWNVVPVVSREPLPLLAAE